MLDYLPFDGVEQFPWPENSLLSECVGKAYELQRLVQKSGLTRDDNWLVGPIASRAYFDKVNEEKIKLEQYIRDARHVIEAARELLAASRMSEDAKKCGMGWVYEKDLKYFNELAEIWINNRATK